MKKVNLFYLLLLSFLIVNVANAQKCKPNISNTDEITEETTNFWGGKLHTKSAIVNGKGHAIKILVGKESGDNSKPFVILNIANDVPAEDSDIFDVSFSEGSEYIIKTEEGIIKLKIDKVFKSKKRFMSTFTVTNQIVSSLTEEDLKLLSTGNITIFRVITENGQKIEGKVKSKNAKKLKAQFTCFTKQ